MWRRTAFTQLKTLISRPTPFPKPPPSVIPRFTPSSSLSLSRPFSSDSGVSKPTKNVEEVMPIATGHEREELEAELEGKDLYEYNHPSGPFGTKESPAIVKSCYDRRIVGCPGGEGEDEHNVIWFWLEKDKPFECPMCTQYFKLEVIGPGGDPEAHDHDEDEHHY